MIRLWLTVLVAGCGFAPAASGDAGGSADAPPDSPADASCRSTCASATMLTDCVTGVPSTCPLGCRVDASGDRCAWVVPSNGADLTNLEGATADLAITVDATFDGVSGSIVTDVGSVVLRSPVDGVSQGMRLTRLTSGVVVLGVHSLTVQNGVTLRITGSHPVIVFAATDLSIEGIVDGSADTGPCSAGDQRQCGGPGAGRGGDATTIGTGCSPGGAGFAGGGDETGGGGGGYGVLAGGNGATSGNPGGQGGAGNCSTTQIVPLLGGSGGGGGGVGGAGGGGGGALQLTALGMLTVHTPTSGMRAGIKVNGAGGRKGSNGSGGGGGGSGGVILLEAQAVTIDAATLVANAGGGGAGDGGSDGGDGRFDDQGAAGGTSGSNRNGGGGGSKTTTPGNATGTGDGTGGGGGGVGRIFINTGAGYYMVIDGGLVSPMEFIAVPPTM